MSQTWLESVNLFKKLTSTLENAQTSLQSTRRQFSFDRSHSGLFRTVLYLFTSEMPFPTNLNSLLSVASIFRTLFYYIIAALYIPNRRTGSILPLARVNIWLCSESPFSRTVPILLIPISIWFTYANDHNLFIQSGPLNHLVRQDNSARLVQFQQPCKPKSYLLIPEDLSSGINSADNPRHQFP
jgi:hypothetical protein